MYNGKFAKPFSLPLAGVTILLWATINICARDVETWVFVSADTEGKVTQAFASSELAQRTSALAELRRRNQNLVLVEAGNAFFGSDSFASTGKVIAAAYKAMAYDAVNLSYRDFYFGKAVTLGLVQESSLPAISANLLDEKTSQPLVRPYVVRMIGGEKWAIIGVTDMPAGLRSLSHIKKQLAGITVQPPLDALARWLPEAKREAGRIVLAYYGSAGGLKPILAKHGDDFAAVAVGGVRPEFLPVKTPVPLVACAEQGEDLGAVRLSSDGRKAEAELLAIDDTVPSDPAMAKLVAGYMVQPGVIAAQTGGIHRTLREGRNRAVSVRVANVKQVDEVGSIRAAQGRKFLAVSMVWENIIPLKLGEKAALATEYRIENIGDHLYLVIDGRTVVRLHPKSEQMPGHIPATNFRLESAGSRIEGEAVFEIPEMPSSTMDVRFYDFAHGNFAIPLTLPEKAVEPVKSISALQKNAVIEAGVFGLKRAKEIGGKKAANGKTFTVVDLRARSLLTLEVDAKDFYSGAKEGEMTKVGSVADWKESRKYLQLVVDGEYAYSPLSQSTLGEEPRFLPDIMTGGDLVFEIPEKSQSLELRCDFPNTDAEDEQAKRPVGLTLAIEGKRPPVPVRQPIAAAVDEMFKVTVTTQSAMPEYAGKKADEEKQFFVVDVTVANTAKGGEFFQTKDQLKYADEAGESVEMDEISDKTPHPASEIIWVPGGERRSFQVVYQIPISDKRPRILFSGSTSGQTLNLNRLQGRTSPPQPNSQESGEANNE